MKLLGASLCLVEEELWNLNTPFQRLVQVSNQLMLRIKFRNLQNNLPLIGFVRISPIMSSVGKYSI